MDNIMRIVDDCPDRSDIEGNIRGMRGGDQIWEKMKDHLDEIIAISAE